MKNQFQPLFGSFVVFSVKVGAMTPKLGKHGLLVLCLPHFMDILNIFWMKYSNPIV
jgi:hypothetical protein